MRLAPSCGHVEQRLPQRLAGLRATRASSQQLGTFASGQWIGLSMQLVQITAVARVPQYC